jgi:threonine dehydrogenase-like Zn-dependent dehydrogenase
VNVRALAIFPQKRAIDVIQIPEEKIGHDRDVKIHVLDVGICGTDREIARFQYGSPPAGSDFLVLGHEALAEVVEIGAGVKEFAPGDLVVPIVRHPCQHAWCGPCRMNRPDFCISGDFIERGIKQEHGFMRCHLVERPEFLAKVPDGLRDVAVLTEPLTIAEKAFGQVRQILERLPWFPEAERPQPLKVRGDSRALVVGAGPMGLLGAMRLRVSGYKTFVYSLEPAESLNARLAVAAGCEYVSARACELPDLQRKIEHIDLIYEATGVSKIAFALMKYMGDNGIMVLTGVPAIGNPIPTDVDVIMRNLVLRNQLVFGTVNAGHEDHQKAITSLGVFQERWPRVLRSMIAGRYPLDSVRELLEKKPPGIKHVVEPG